MGAFSQVGEQLVGAYYNMFDTNRSNLISMYSEQSMMTFEGEQMQRAQPIVQKLVSLPFKTVRHQIVKADCQPTPTGGVLVFVTGHLYVDESPNPLKFARIFHLCQSPGTGNYFVQNDMFRLNIG